MTNNIAVPIKKKYSLSEFQSKMNRYEYYLNWIPEREAFNAEAEVMRSNILCVDLNPENFCEQMYNKLTHAFLSIILKDFSRLPECFVKIEQLIHIINYYEIAKNLGKKIYVTEDNRRLHSRMSAIGFWYLLNGLKLHLYIEKSKQNNDVTGSFNISNLQNFEDLGVKPKICILALKYRFMNFKFQNKCNTSPYYLKVGILEQLINLDPDNYDWYFSLYLAKRIERRKDLNIAVNNPTDRGPTCHEMETILKAVEMANNRNPFVIVEWCKFLAEVMKYRWNDWDNLLYIGDKITFANVVEAFEHIQSQLRMALNLNAISGLINVTIAEIYYVCLPINFQDNKMAKRCLLRANLFEPNSFTSNSRLGYFYLTAGNNRTKAAVHFLKAFQADRFNFPALFDLLLTLMGLPYENATKLKEIFEVECGLSHWGDRRKGQLYIVRGIFNFMVKDEVLAIENWVEACSISLEAPIVFRRYEFFKYRFGWPENICTLQMFDDAVKRGYCMSIKDPVMKKATTTLSDFILVAMRDTKHQAFVGSRGDRGLHPRSRGQPNPFWKEFYQSPVIMKPTDIHFESLGIPRTASKQQMETAYRDIYLRLHSGQISHGTQEDKDENLRKMKEVNEAYETLVVAEF